MSPSEQGPHRTCCVCRESCDRQELVRWVRDEEGEVFPDILGRAFGRGAWVHPRADCLKRLIPQLKRAFKADVKTTPAAAIERLSLAGAHRANQLLASARRQGVVIFGGDACEKAEHTGTIEFFVVAQDAQALAKRPFVLRAVSSGRAVAWGRKADLGQLLARGDVAVLGVKDRGLARRLFGAIAMALLAPTIDASSPTTRPEHELSSEVE